MRGLSEFKHTKIMERTLMKNRSSLALAAAFATIATTAFADWETTRWGMSQGEVLAVLDGAVRHDPTPAEIYEHAGQSYAPLVKLSQAVEGIAGEVSLLFDSGEQLYFVLFNPADIADCDALGAALTERHGAADAIAAGGFSISDWVADGDAIKLTNAPLAGICNLSLSAN